MKRAAKKIMALLTSSIFILNAVGTKEVYAADAATEWNYSYTGKEQVFEAPYSGVYQFSLSGAQGGGDKGGRGGNVTVTINISKGTKLSIYVGGNSGYNGGGAGNEANGGGATDIRINGNRIAIAGGGGGGTGMLQGGDGGSGGDNGIDYIGSSELDKEGSAGGGGGHKGGSAGYYYTELVTPHTHSDSCYSICSGTVTYGDANNDGLSVGSCNKCGTTFANRDQQPGKHPEPHTCNNRTLICTKPTTPELQIFSKASSGGSSWYDSNICSTGISTAGVREGNGECRVSAKEIYNLFYLNIPCKNVYYNGIKVKKVYYNGILIYQE